MNDNLSVHSYGSYCAWLLWRPPIRRWRNVRARYATKLTVGMDAQSFAKS